ncbi:TPA: hypothetical protein U2I44_000773 [Providencia rettgeri]|nr:hypothetical protein [Providencia rettgeri]
MGFKHSPAPWRCHDKRPSCSGYSIVGNDGQYIAFVGDSDELSPIDANAMLIAAAPELLEALQGVMKYLVDFYGEDDDFYPEHPLAVAKAAITKALGQQ